MKAILISIFFLSTISLATQKLFQNNTTLQISFKIKNFGRTVNGKFTNTQITSNFDKNNLKNSFIKAIIKVNSIDTDNKKRDKHLLNEDYFDQNQFSEIKLNSTSIIKLDQNNYQMLANLTIKSVTENIKVPLKIIETDNSISIKSNFTINRRDYGVGGKSWVLSDLVKIEINYLANK
jgi:polyisoprenoid-binding protein YceI